VSATGAMVIAGALAPQSGSSIPAVPWRDPYTVSPRDLAAYIGSLEQSCREHPNSPELWTCLGMAYAVNYDVVKSMDALETATAIEPAHFWARLKYGELHYRLRALDKAEGETLKAVALAEDALQLSMARKQLREIRALNPQRVRQDAPASAWGRMLFVSGLLMFAVAVVMWA
jgi:tetratricopeptide (TPR) repeat protein